MALSLQLIYSVSDVLRPGTELLGAGYCMYGSSTQFVFSIGNGVHGFTLDPTIGEFVMSHPNIKIPENSKRVRPSIDLCIIFKQISQVCDLVTFPTQTSALSPSILA